MKKLYIFRGLPGSGKSTRAHQMAPLVIEPDMFRYTSTMEYVFDSEKNGEIHAKVLDFVVYAMRHLRMPAIAIAATHTKIGHMRRYIKLGRKYGYDVTVVECYGDRGNIHDVPPAVIAKMDKEFEPMTPGLQEELGVGYASYTLH